MNRPRIQTVCRASKTPPGSPGIPLYDGTPTYYKHPGDPGYDEAEYDVVIIHTRHVIDTPEKARKLRRTARKHANKTKTP